MKYRIQQGFTLIELLVVITIIAILASLAVPTFSKIQEKGNITKGISNARQVITTLRLYSSDNNGQYPDADTTTKPDNANDAFRLMFVGGQADNEQIFGCPNSEYGGNPDGNIGNADSKYTEAVKEKENHWCLAGGLSDSASGTYPLVWECATDKAYDPTWSPKDAGKTAKGRTWSGGKIVVGMNDSSVTTLVCDIASGKLKPAAGSTTDAFSQNTQGGGTAPTVLDVK